MTGPMAMHRRRLGRTGLMVSEVGYGAWGIGGGVWGAADDAASLRALERAIDLGMNFIDTALAYGPHHSEQLIGRAVRRSGQDVVVTTKVPPKNLQWPARADVALDEILPGAHIRHCVERSLRNLQTETIDLLQLHAWRDEWLGQGDWQETIEALRSEGKLRFFGVSANDGEPDNARAIVSSGVVDTVQVVYNVFEQRPQDALLPLCAEHDVGVIARVPFDEGGLTGAIQADTTFAADDFRAAYFRGDRARQVAERAQAIAEDLGRSTDQLAELALRFVLSNPAVSTVVAGMRSVRNVERNCAVADGRGLPAREVADLHAHRWERNFYA
jgi:aryl-alcohol dehydrogenase-like predicted oxidoreductase